MGGNMNQYEMLMLAAKRARSPGLKKLLTNRAIAWEVNRVNTAYKKGNMGGALPAYGIEQIGLVTGVTSATGLLLKGSEVGLSGLIPLGTQAAFKMTPKAAVGLFAVGGFGVALAALFSGQHQQQTITQTPTQVTTTNPQQETEARMENMLRMWMQTRKTSTQTTTYNVPGSNNTFGGISTAQSDTAQQSPALNVAPTQEVTASAGQTTSASESASQTNSSMIMMLIMVAAIILMGGFGGSKS